MVSRVNAALINQSVTIKARASYVACAMLVTVTLCLRGFQITLLIVVFFLVPFFLYDVVLSDVISSSVSDLRSYLPSIPQGTCIAARHTTR